MTKDEIFKAYQPLCKKLARQYSRRVKSTEYDDLLQEAQIGLLKAIESNHPISTACLSVG